MQIFRKRAVDVDSLDGFKGKEASLLRYKITNAPSILMLESHLRAHVLGMYKTPYANN